MLNRVVGSCCFIGALLLLPARPARANDGAGGLVAGNLVFKHLDGVRMESEDLFISEKDVRVRYVFRNTTDHDIESLVAFPLPPMPAKNGPLCKDNDVNDWPETYDPCADNPVRFALTIDGSPASFHTDRKPLPVDSKHASWPEESVTHYWTQRFAAGKSIVIEHSYRVAEAVEWISDDADSKARLRRDFCVGTQTHQSLFDIVRGRHTTSMLDQDGTHAQIRSVAYILKTARTWDGPIGQFHLTIEKSTPSDFVSVCLDGLRKTSATRYELRATSYVPRSDLAILFAGIKDVP
jgi:hypothetical protein